jgi:hypothetical protein
MGETRDYLDDERNCALSYVEELFEELGYIIKEYHIKDVDLVDINDTILRLGADILNNDRAIESMTSELLEFHEAAQVNKET